MATAKNRTHYHHTHLHFTFPSWMLLLSQGLLLLLGQEESDFKIGEWLPISYDQWKWTRNGRDNSTRARKVESVIDFWKSWIFKI